MPVRDETSERIETQDFNREEKEKVTGKPNTPIRLCIHGQLILIEKAESSTTYEGITTPGSPQQKDLEHEPVEVVKMVAELRK